MLTKEGLWITLSHMEKEPLSQLVRVPYAAYQLLRAESFRRQVPMSELIASIINNVLPHETT